MAAAAASHRRSLYQGYGDTMTRAIEFVVTPFLLAALGMFLDRRLGTGSVLTVALTAIGVVGTFLRTWFAYVEAMKAEEAKAPWRNR
ncbi:MAG TPA: AtpZ/AtpI family protein [Acidimicrobiales bacterium]|nr:AtpZ/AtpI family protein [Acidimicrobiales bacterium]